MSSKNMELAKVVALAAVPLCLMVAVVKVSQQARARMVEAALPRPTATPVPTLTPLPTATPVPTATASPLPTATPKKQLPIGTSCRVHGTLLQLDTVPVGGSWVYTDYYQAQLQLFPNSNKIVLQGCIVEPNAPTQEEVLFCPQCRLAEEEWLRTHPDRLELRARRLHSR